MSCVGCFWSLTPCIAWGGYQHSTASLYLLPTILSHFYYDLNVSTEESTFWWIKKLLILMRLFLLSSAWIKGRPFHGKAWLNTGANDSVYLIFFPPILGVKSKRWPLAKKNSFILASSLPPTQYYQGPLQENGPECLLSAHYEMIFQPFQRLIGCWWERTETM